MGPMIEREPGLRRLRSLIVVLLLGLAAAGALADAPPPSRPSTAPT